MTPRRRVVLLGTLFTLFAAAIVATVVGVRSRAYRLWGDVLVRADAAEEQLEARSDQRSVLDGELLPGSAFEEYDKAVAFAAKVNDEDPAGEVSEEVWFDPQRAPEACWSVVTRLRPAFDHVGAGAQRSNPRREIRWREGMEAALPMDLPAVTGLASYARLHVWRCLEAGEFEAATRVWLAFLQFGGDYVRDPILITKLVGAAVQSQMLSLVASHPAPDQQPGAIAPRIDELPAALRKQWAEALQSLDALPFDPADSFRAETLAFARQCERSLLGEGTGIRVPWRYLFSERLMVASGLLQMFEFSDRLRAGADYETVVSASARTSENPLIRLALPNLTGVAESMRTHRAELRACRMLLLGPEALRLADPFGKAGELLLRRVEGPKTIIWSRGKDGRDDGGDSERDVVFVR